ncbi:GIY-YIG nuclease family protein [Chitinophaga silvatica]|uniref:GIY-YIG nuclease family protein n=1 Tax=Chitinophaga silvatica TaxID=2282649 RepID=A0A3E1Y3G2_9BACT|nr:GIY-YIG nuclease family protein [Chitinophaga silvatica]RFS19220.1 GIY-YIG nuclease family protein [Chitinophaga silvatica]
MSQKKDLKMTYKEIQFRKGVYQLRNTRNNKLYIGSSMDLDRAWNSLNLQLKMGNFANTLLQQEWNDQQGQDFVYEIVEVLKETNDPQADVKADVKTLERLVMMELQPFGDKGYHTQKL